MAVTVLENGWISDSFQMGSDPYFFSDAIVLPPDQYNALTPDQIQSMKQQRYDNWYAIVTAPSPDLAPTFNQGV